MAHLFDKPLHLPTAVTIIVPELLRRKDDRPLSTVRALSRVRLETLLLFQPVSLSIEIPDCTKLAGFPMPPSALRLIEAFVPEVLAASNVGAWEYDVVNDRFRCDHAIAALFEFSKSEAAFGLPLKRLAITIHPDDQDDARARRQHILLHGGPFVMEYRIQTASGAVRRILHRGRYEKDAQGNVIRGRGITVAITESEESNGPFFFAMADEDEEAESSLEQAARHAIAARKAIDELDPLDASQLRKAVDALLMILGRYLAKVPI